MSQPRRGASRKAKDQDYHPKYGAVGGKHGGGGGAAASRGTSAKQQEEARLGRIAAAAAAREANAQRQQLNYYAGSLVNLLVFCALVTAEDVFGAIAAGDGGALFSSLFFIQNMGLTGGADGAFYWQAHRVAGSVYDVLVSALEKAAPTVLCSGRRGQPATKLLFYRGTSRTSEHPDDGEYVDRGGMRIVVTLFSAATGTLKLFEGSRHCASLALNSFEWYAMAGEVGGGAKVVAASDGWTGWKKGHIKHQAVASADGARLCFIFDVNTVLEKAEIEQLIAEALEGYLMSKYG